MTSFVTFNRGDMKAVQVALSGINDAAPTVMMRAMNKTLIGVKTDATAEVYQDLNLTKTRIRKDFSIFKASKFDMGAKIVSAGKPVGLVSFSGTRQTKKGASVKVKRLGARKIIPHAFIQTAKSAKNVWRRAIKGGRRVARYPIERLTGPRIQDILDDKSVMGRVMKKADERLSGNLKHETDYFLGKL